MLYASNKQTPRTDIYMFKQNKTKRRTSYYLYLLYIFKNTLTCPAVIELDSIFCMEDLITCHACGEAKQKSDLWEGGSIIKI